MRWHLIGHLQRKQGEALDRFSLLHALDSARLADAVHEFGERRGRPVDALLQVNVAGEETKGGFEASDVQIEAERLRALGGVHVTGVMTMAPFDANESELRRVFAGARAARAVLRGGSSGARAVDGHVGRLRGRGRGRGDDGALGHGPVRSEGVMSDEAFHLTPVDARRYDFGSALRGYDKTRVDQFRDQVADELERLSRVNQELEAKAKGFHEQLRAFRERDKALNDALISAQQLRAETREQADREAQLILREARAEGERLLEDTRTEVRRLQVDIDALERARRNYLAQMRSMAERQLAELQSAETASAAPARPKPEEGDEEHPPVKSPSWLDANVQAE